MYQHNKHLAEPWAEWPHQCVKCALDPTHPVHQVPTVDTESSTVDPQGSERNAARVASALTPSVAPFADLSTVDMSVAARVARGVRYLRQAYPDALLRIDIDEVDITDGVACVLGQLWGSYTSAPELVTETWEWRVAHGFLFSAEDDELWPDLHDALSAEWRGMLREWLGDRA